MKPKTLRQRARALSRQLNTPAGEILNMIGHAGLDAIEATLAHRGKVTLPLAFDTAGDVVPPLNARTVTELPMKQGMGKAFLIAHAEPETLPIHLPAADVQLLRELCKAAYIEAGPDWMILDMVSTIASDSLGSTRRSMRGAPDILASMWDLPAEVLDAMQTVVDRWNDNAGGAA